MSVSFSALVLSLTSLLGWGAAEEVRVQGYVEVEYVLVAPQIAGSLEEVTVKRGDAIKKGAPLFSLERQAEILAVEGAQAEANQKAAQLADLLKGKRQPELDALLAQRAQALAAHDLAKINFDRDQKLLKTKSISQADWDVRRAALEQARAKLAEVEAALVLAGQSQGRDDAIKAAEASLVAAYAARAQAQWKLEQKTVFAPADAFVFDTLYQTGEYIPQGQAVVSLLPPENIKVRFFLNDTQLGQVHVGDTVHISTRALSQPVVAHISYVSPTAEYTPPQLYNRDNREKLIYMIEAKPENPAQLTLHPGQPVDVTFAPPATKS